MTNIMVWGCTSWEGVGELTKVEGNMNSDHYQNILHDSMSMLVVKFNKEMEEWVFQQDINPKHINESTIKWFNDHMITELPCSPQSSTRILSNTSRTKWIGASDSIKTSPLARMNFGRSCRRNETTLRWKSYSRW